VTNEIQQNRYDRLVRRVAGIIGPGSKVNEVLTELFPMLDVESDRGELQLLAGIKLGMGSQVLIGSAGQTAKIQLFNPVGSGILVTITSMFISHSANTTVRVSRDIGPLANGIGTQTTRDYRETASDRPTAQMFSEDSAGFVNGNMQFLTLGRVQLVLQDVNGVAVLAPGTGVSVSPTTVALTSSVTFFWRERPAEASELRF